MWGGAFFLHTTSKLACSKLILLPTSEYSPSSITLQLVAGGCRPDTHDVDGQAPLHKAVLYGQQDAVQGLVLAGADLNIQDGSNSTAAHVRIAGQSPYPPIPVWYLFLEWNTCTAKITCKSWSIFCIGYYGRLWPHIPIPDLDVTNIGQSFSYPDLEMSSFNHVTVTISLPHSSLTRQWIMLCSP